jgi:acetoacetate decarboxylase
MWIAIREGAMVTRAAMGGSTVVTIATTTEAAIAADELPATSPSWLLKVIPRADGPGPAIKQLIDATPAGRDAVVHAAYRGLGTVEFQPSPFGDFTPLAPREYGPAFVFESSYTESFATVAYDYLAAE